jgi:hypothetical protein
LFGHDLRQIFRAVFKLDVLYLAITDGWDIILIVLVDFLFDVYEIAEGLYEGGASRKATIFRFIIFGVGRFIFGKRIIIGVEKIHNFTLFL